MTEFHPACTAEAFEQRYQASADPWDFAASPYELGRYEAILRTLRRPRYRLAFEPGCSVGVLTSKLAQRCDFVVATEVSPTALEEARRRCSDATNIQFELRDVADALPPGRFDLIVFSEIGYYFSAEELAQVAQALAEALEPGGELIAVHWLGESEDHVLHGDVVHQTLEQVLPLNRFTSIRHSGYRLDGWTRDA